ncbi:uncharacterized protein LOC135161488 [Diachasmimorpha longicaudata]|uniref:uncharacterized protein LOC135161488 n=1 Tax=Diachasmimorpha longicaudata TaxID=58733 RepID=UPI0030B86FD6
MLEEGQDTLGVFIDIEGAFDNTSFDTIEKAAASFGIEESVTKWIAAMLRTRVVHSTLGDSAVRAAAGWGCRRGGLSPLCCGSSLSTASSLDSKSWGDASTLHNKMQKALNYVQHWCTSKGLRVNPGKTEMVHFTSRRRGAVKAPSIYNTELEFSGEVKYLGIWLDKKSSWKKHIAMQTNKLAYAAAVWWTALNKARHRKAVDRVGRLAMLGITGALRTTPSSALEALLFMQPPPLIIREEATKAAARLRLQGTWKEARNGHGSVLRADGELEGLLSCGADACRETPSEEDADWGPPRGLVWYTDGSRVSGRAGAGVWSEGPAIARTIGLDSHATVLQTELAALKELRQDDPGERGQGQKDRHLLRQQARAEGNAQV